MTVSLAAPTPPTPPQIRCASAQSSGRFASYLPSDPSHRRARLRVVLRHATLRTHRAAPDCRPGSPCGCLRREPRMQAGS
jgi:hypothetical protein